MADPVRLILPATKTGLTALQIGEEVLLSGVVYAARDATHARIAEGLHRDGSLPFGLAGQALFYAGPTPPAAGRPAGAIGPTTAGRMDAWTPEFLAAGITVTIGKGARSPEVARACAEHGAVYLAVVGGSAALSATRVTAMEPIAYDDLGTEALVRVTLDDLPAFVAIDTRGRDLFTEARETWREDAG